MPGSPSESIQSLLNELAGRLDSELAAAAETAAAEAAAAARAAAVETLNVAIRRLRAASNVTEIGATLLETASAYCGRIALLVHKGELLTGWRACGFSVEFNEAWTSFQMNVPDAAAVAQAIQNREAVISLATPENLSAAFIEALAIPSEEKVYLFPLGVRQAIVAVAYADGAGASDRVLPAALELLCQVAESAIEALSSRSQPRQEASPGALELPMAPAPAREPPADWSAMSPSDRDSHLRAQRFARVLVADLQLYRSKEIREGKKTQNIYGRLKEEIDKSREVYRRKFGQPPTAGIDYFHLELLRALADEQEALLGPDYPGPMIEPEAE